MWNPSPKPKKIKRNKTNGSFHKEYHEKQQKARDNKKFNSSDAAAHL